MNMLPSTRTPVLVYVDNPGILYDTIIVLGRTQDMTGATIAFSMRPLESREPVLSAAPADAIVPVNQNGNNVAYTWGNVVEGEYMGWWTFTLPGAQPQDSPEFPIYVTDQGPGLATQTGVIVDGVAAYMPITLNALRQDDRFGDKWLQQQATVLEYRVLGYAVDPDQESTTMHPVLVDYMSKRLALGLVRAGIEYWSRQYRTVTTTQTSEVASYPDMIASLKDLRSSLIHDCAQEWRDLLLIVPGLPQRKVVPLPQSSIGNQWDRHHRVHPNTRDPREMPPLETGGWGWGLEWGVWPFP